MIVRLRHDIISLVDIRAIPKNKHWKRPLSLLQGWGEQPSAVIMTATSHKSQYFRNAEGSLADSYLLPFLAGKKLKDKFEKR
jgi:hypothetical protein